MLAAIQAAVSAAVLPLRQEVEQMKAACFGDTTENEEEEEQNGESKEIHVDARHKRSSDTENSNILHLRKTVQVADRPSRIPRTIS